MKVPTYELQDLEEQIAKIDAEAAKLKSETDEGLDKVEAMVHEHDKMMFPEHDEVHVHEEGYGCCDFASSSSVPLYIYFFIHSLRHSEVGCPKQS